MFSKKIRLDNSCELSVAWHDAVSFVSIVDQSHTAEILSDRSPSGEYLSRLNLL